MQHHRQASPSSTRRRSGRELCHRRVCRRCRCYSRSPPLLSSSFAAPVAAVERRRRYCKPRPALPSSSQGRGAFSALCSLANSLPFSLSSIASGETNAVPPSSKSGGNEVKGRNEDICDGSKGINCDVQEVKDWL